jgi:hypothetical protein
LADQQENNERCCTFPASQNFLCPADESGWREGTRRKIREGWVCRLRRKRKKRWGRRIARETVVRVKTVIRK